MNMSTTEHLRATIDAAFERRAELNPQNLPAELGAALEQCLELLDSGRLRVAQPVDGRWVVNEWLKKAVLLSFRVRDNVAMEAGYTRFFDKVPLKYAGATESALRAGGARIVPHALVRRGAYIAPDVVLMPSYVNIGAYVGAGTMVDTWATVGSCAQIGRNVHLSGGVGIGGVLEPLQASPTIIEDDCFIGARSEIVEGVIVEAGSVISMGVFIGQSTRIYDPAGPRAGGLGGGIRHPARGRRPLQPVLRRHRQARRRPDARQNLRQRTAAQCQRAVSSLRTCSARRWWG